MLGLKGLLGEKTECSRHRFSDQDGGGKTAKAAAGKGPLALGGRTV